MTLKFSFPKILFLGFAAVAFIPCRAQLSLDPSYTNRYGFISEIVNAGTGMGLHSGTGSQYQSDPGTYLLDANDDENYQGIGQSSACTATVSGNEEFSSSLNELSGSASVDISTSVLTVSDGADANSEFRVNFAFTADTPFLLTANLSSVDPNAFLIVQSSSSSVLFTGSGSTSGQLLPAGYYQFVAETLHDTVGDASNGDNDSGSNLATSYSFNIATAPEPPMTLLILLAAGALMFVGSRKKRDKFCHLARRRID